ncbi:hypothetical protein KNO81_23425 [Paraburkholderia sediminicola]|nr:hypothetical protein [Paraburkholderia sediminicola]
MDRTPIGAIVEAVLERCAREFRVSAEIDLFKTALKPACAGLNAADPLPIPLTIRWFDLKLERTVGIARVAGAGQDLHI